MKNQKRAFTLTETLTALLIIGTLAIFTAASTVNSSKVKQQKLIAGSKIFYTELDLGYQNVVAFETDKINITSLKGVYEVDLTKDSTKLKELFGKYLDVTDDDCTIFPKTVDTEPFLVEETQCGMSAKGYNVGFYLDRTCLTEVNYIEYYQKDDMELKTHPKTCGFMVYAPRHSNGVLGEDFWVVPLGKRGLK